ncbi:MAG: CDP-diacylglycerol--serine O-phosphatidyltransferase [Methylicorpusculum sp.]|uniref:CDP-diacylglycerol--serine O-phosphatidyltransferase n=1 Tax=Methylicorpusculum sp. TaxID=2713644 RepID=UPI00271A70F4|nr:CDP-diacylglycerol--serine O-phosphatidyltransferase [Methylicorpusculum sp.]MDO8843267.1 CDP-diacylglycerol--serine O-phosphatidyltransferase [Methylicorpusculum sp.]MDO8938633.1 CDP-diacylglycerol--serine O-phosphatidyltransferase [Methylicorpusculum sp.]MDP2178457.1 CDP-diacylglycerol--serine O-phosphatidyltransferase [Methylicorpusculum sp.]MDP2204311.1 CDP-diacylglycerol--serine O-phosphatidyltransferase [Methylicorpusculum sp.]MDP3529806.1 CDP-diacylglycerol--serine O-phosphatidyltran
MATEKKSIRRRGIYLLPNLFTTGALFSGFYAITSAMGGRYETAAVAIFVAMILDGLDGRVARLTNTQSEFGVQYDSLSDMVSFGVAPALVMYLYAFSSLGRLGLFAAFVHTAGGALRLARFNTQVEKADKRYFQGLPSPAAAAILAGFIWLSLEHGYDIEVLKYLAMLLTVATGLLMVSNFRYSSFKEIDLKGKVPFVVAIVVMLAVAFIMAQPQTMLFLLFLGYAISGPVITLVMRKRRLQDRKS